jgi:hypothetical protein
MRIQYRNVIGLNFEYVEPGYADYWSHGLGRGQSL